jgi:hypothetical protein
LRRDRQEVGRTPEKPSKRNLHGRGVEARDNVRQAIHRPDIMLNLFREANLIVHLDDFQRTITMRS